MYIIVRLKWFWCRSQMHGCDVQNLWYLNINIKRNKKMLRAATMRSVVRAQTQTASKHRPTCAWLTRVLSGGAHTHPASEGWGGGGTRARSPDLTVHKKRNRLKLEIKRIQPSDHARHPRILPGIVWARLLSDPVRHRRILLVIIGHSRHTYHGNVQRHSRRKHRAD